MTEYESRAHARDIDLARAEKYSPSPSCLKCSHAKVCFLYRSEVVLLSGQYGQLQKKDWPNLPEDRAKICKWYILEEDDSNEYNQCRNRE